VQSLEHARLFLCRPGHPFNVPSRRQLQAEECGTGPVPTKLLDGEYVGPAHQDDGVGSNAIPLQCVQALQRPPNSTDGRGADKYDRHGQCLDEHDLKLRLVERRQGAAERLNEQVTARHTGPWFGLSNDTRGRNGAALLAGRQQRCHRMLKLAQGLVYIGPRHAPAHSLRIRIPGFQRLPVLIVVGQRGQPQQRQRGLPLIGVCAKYQNICHGVP